MSAFYRSGCVKSACVQGEDSIDYFLGLTPSGIIVLRNRTKVTITAILSCFVMLGWKIFVFNLKIFSGRELLLAADQQDLLQGDLLHAASAGQNGETHWRFCFTLTTIFVPKFLRKWAFWHNGGHHSYLFTLWSGGGEMSVGPDWEFNEMA